MNHAITIGGLLLSVGALLGFLCTATGVLMYLAGSMSDAPELGEASGKQGCITALAGAVLLGGCLFGLLR